VDPRTYIGTITHTYSVSRGVSYGNTNPGTNPDLDPAAHAATTAAPNCHASTTYSYRNITTYTNNGYQAKASPNDT
jgi:hypothetical protein